MRIILFVLVCSLLFSSCFCECCGCEGAAGEIDLTVLDMDNKPISGVTLGPYTYQNGVTARSFLNQTYLTDAKGQIHVNYVFPIDSYTDWTLAATDFNDFKAINYVKSPYSYTPEHKKITTIDTIRMDVVKPMTLRFKSNKTDVQGLFLRVYVDDYLTYIKVKRDFYYNITPHLLGTALDTTIQVNAYSKAELYISAGLRFQNSTLNVYQSKKLDNYERRDSVILFQF